MGSRTRPFARNPPILFNLWKPPTLAAARKVCAGKREKLSKAWGSVTGKLKRGTGALVEETGPNSRSPAMRCPMALHNVMPQKREIKAQSGVEELAKGADNAALSAFLSWHPSPVWQPNCSSPLPSFAPSPEPTPKAGPSPTNSLPHLRSPPPLTSPRAQTPFTAPQPPPLFPTPAFLPPGHTRAPLPPVHTSSSHPPLPRTCPDPPPTLRTTSH